MFLPFVAREVTSIGGVPQRTVMGKRDASGLVNPWTFGTLTETTWVNPTLTNGVPTPGSPKTVRDFVASTRADTRTSPVGRTVSRVLDTTLLDWDADGRLISSTRLEEIHGPSWSGGAPNQSLERSYLGPKLQSEELIGNANGAVSWTYDGHHRVATESVNAGHTVTMGYDADGLLTGAGELTIVREPASGRVQTITNTYGGSTFVEARTYDAFGALQSLTYTRGGATLFAVTYVRDDLGRIATQLETVSVALGGTGVEVEIAYAYDLAGRLTTVLRDAVETEFYQYDKNGNRTLAEYDDGAVTRAGAYDDQDRLTTYGPWTATHDDNGTLLERATTGAGLTDVTYDAFGNLTSIHADPADILLGYRADGRHRRVSRQVDSDPPTKWIWSSDLRPAAQVDATDAVTHRYIYAEGVNVPDLVIHVSSGERWRPVKDHLGTVRFVVDVATGDVIRGLEVDAFGRVTSSSGDLTAVPFGFAGGLWEPVTGLVRFGARDYDPETGRWTAKDPVRFDGGDSNIYAYVGNDPVNGTDPSGTREVPRDCKNPDGYNDCNADCDSTFKCPGPECKRPSAWLECYDWCNDAFCKGEGAKDRPIGRECP